MCVCVRMFIYMYIHIYTYIIYPNLKGHLEAKTEANLAAHPFIPDLNGPVHHKCRSVHTDDGAAAWVLSYFACRPSVSTAAVHGCEGPTAALGKLGEGRGEVFPHVIEGGLVPARVRRDAIVCMLVPTPPHVSLKGMRAERTSGPAEEAHGGERTHDISMTRSRPSVAHELSARILSAQVRCTCQHGSLNI